MEKYVFQSLSFKYLSLRSRRMNFRALRLDTVTQKKFVMCKNRYNSHEAKEAKSFFKIHRNL